MPLLKVCVRLEPNVESTRIVEVSDWEGTKVDIVVGGSRAVDDDGADDTFTILVREMRVVPRGSCVEGWSVRAFCGLEVMLSLPY